MAAADLSAPALPGRTIAWIWTRHLTSLYIPVNSLLFLCTGPHSWYVAFLFMVSLLVARRW